MTGEKTPIRGKAELKIEIGSQDVGQDECILGLDFLVLHEYQVDLREDALYIGEEEVPLMKARSNLESRCYRTVLVKSVSIPPQTEVIVNVRVEGMGSSERWGVVEPVSNPRRQDPILVGRTLVDLQHSVVSIRLVNLASEGKRELS